MSQCKECGATLPEDSRFCLQCGTENKPPQERPTLPEKELEFLRPAITGGLALGILSSIPLINLLNFICFLWPQAGGGLTAWLLDRQRPGTLKYSDGAFGGVFSGLIGAIVSTIISIPIYMLTLTPEGIAQVQARFDQLQGMQEIPWFRELMTRFLSDMTFRTMLTLVFNMISFGLFAMIGGIIAAAILARKRLD